MSGINGETQVPYSYAIEFSLVCFLCVMLLPMDGVVGSALKSPPHQLSPELSNREMIKSIYPTAPYFDEIYKRDIEAIEGQTVIIPCTVTNLSREKVVSWIRSKDIHILSSGPHIFSSDYRFEVVHNDRNIDFWGLRIRGVKADDTGQYECQVNTEPKMSLAFKLTVSSLGSDDNSKWLGYSKIDGPKEVFVQHGTPFHVSCMITPIFTRNINLDAWWLHEDTQILFQPKESRISIQTAYDKNKNQIHSILSFEYVTWQDVGLYTCLQPSVKKDSLKLVIVEAESSEAMQRDFPISSHSTKKFTDLFSINVLLLCTTLYIALFY
ncbi:unnamed protein product [Ceutorhynchus assimilis]|uniref:Ig-like domain-containing protein n=1 Tax=Ceutorhynchus assimilis TaxID=467358 RepID=A0A9N9QJ42_9CUCU|nr:unnamed protein product [Ceutorhynchus assimilis]